MGFLKKRTVPSELPSLSIDTINQQITTEIQRELPPVQSLNRLNQNNPSQIATSPGQRPPSTLPSMQQRTQIIQNQFAQKAQTIPTNEIPLAAQNEQGFFKDILSNFTEESKDLEKLNKWYESAFSDDIVNQMKDYWEKNKTNLVTSHVGKDLKIKIEEKTKKLHSLEKEWQDVYFRLMAKEDEIREEEKTLKETLGDLVQTYNRYSLKNKVKE